MSLIIKHGAVLQAWACLALVFMVVRIINVPRGVGETFCTRKLTVAAYIYK